MVTRRPLKVDFRKRSNTHKINMTTNTPHRAVKKPHIFTRVSNFLISGTLSEGLKRFLRTFFRWFPLEINKCLFTNKNLALRASLENFSCWALSFLTKGFLTVQWGVLHWTHDLRWLEMLSDGFPTKCPALRAQPFNVCPINAAIRSHAPIQPCHTCSQH